VNTPSATLQVEASSDVDIPERSWAEIYSAVANIATKLFPDKVVALMVVSEQRITELNRAHRGVATPTDVLSFPPGAAASRGHAGDIAICWNVAQRQARQNGNTVETEAVALITHGLLHLAGFDHDTIEADKLMDSRTRQLCREAGYPVRTYGH
jgi:probable rRNA maturation factor